MKSVYDGVKISGVFTAVPSNAVTFEDEVSQYDFPVEQSLRLKKVMGFGVHRIVKTESCASDLAVAALQYLFDEDKLAPEDIGALIFVSQTPDAPMPPTSNLIQGRLNLADTTLCIDINQGCAGFIIGCMLGFSILKTGDCRKVAVINADTLSRRCSKNDRNIFPMVGDAAAITVLERGVETDHILANIHMDGKGANALRIPAGGMRIPSSSATMELKDVGDGNKRSQEHFYMEGSEVFNFVVNKVPALIDETLGLANRTKDDIDYYIFHQPNKFILQKLSGQANIPTDKLFTNIVENFGNASSATIPTNMCFNLGDRLCANSFKILFAGFGVGLSWGAMSATVGPLNFCEWKEFDI